MAEDDESSEGEGELGGDVLYEPGRDVLLGHVAPRYVEVLCRLFLSRLRVSMRLVNAMNSATDNASELISSLTLQMNRARQAAIMS